MRPLGVSDKVFYYNSSYRTTFTIRIGMTFHALNLTAFGAAAEAALLDFPEFAYRPVIRENRLFAQENHEKPVLAPEDAERMRLFGTDDTAGYLFYFTYSGNRAAIHYFHGLSDYVGMLSFIRCILRHYAALTGAALPEEEAGTFGADTRGSGEDRLDPYAAYAESGPAIPWPYENPGAFAIPGDYPADCEYSHGFRLTTSTSAFLAKTKELGISFIPLLSSMISGAAHRGFRTEGKPVTAMIPVNFRQFFQTETAVNFSDSVLIPMAAEDLALPVPECCRKLKDLMKQQMTADNFRVMMQGKIAMIRKAEEGLPEETAHRMTALPPPGGFRPISYAISYPGAIRLSPGLDALLADLDTTMWIRGNAVLGYTFRDKMELTLLCRTEQSPWISGIGDAFRQMDLPVRLEDLGHVHGDRMILEELDRR